MGRSKNDTSRKPKARLPRGFRDRFGQELVAERAVIEAIRPVFEASGFEPLETSLIEYAEALGTFLPDQDRPNAGVFSFQDEDEAWVSLRYDLTAPLARYVAENFDKTPRPFRRYQTGQVFRNEKPGPGRFREFTQFDVDVVGAPAPVADAEMAMLAADAMEAAGVKRGDYVIRVNHRGALDGALKAAGVDLADASARLTALRALDKLDRLGPEGVRLLLGPGRKDESGDFTAGAGLSDIAIDTLLNFVGAGGATAEESLAAVEAVIGATDEGAAALQDLRAMAGIFAALGYDDGRVVIDPSVVRGLEYYTGPVMEAELTFDIPDDKGRPQRFGSVGGGGRYDGLVGRFRNDATPATGFSVGVSRLAAALAAAKPEAAGARNGPVVVMVLGSEDPARGLACAQELRAAGVKAEAYVGGAGMKAQLKYADKRGAPIAVIEGEDERAAGEVTLKDLALGERLAAEIEDNKAWREDQPAQRAVPRADLVAGVKVMLGREA